MKCAQCGGITKPTTRVSLRRPGLQDQPAESLNRCLRCGYVSLRKERRVDLAGEVPVNNHFEDCPHCGSPVVLTSERTLRGRGGARVWLCSRYPECDTYVGCHPNTSLPMGYPAGPELRRWRVKTHDALDALWKRGIMKRQRVYDWLAEELGLDGWRCHVGHLNLKQCLEVGKLCAARLKSGR